MNLDSILDTVKRGLSKNGAPAFAVFDFDNTCIVNDINEAVLAYMARNDLFRDRELVAHREGSYAEAVFRNYRGLLERGRMKDAYEMGAKIVSGYATREIQGIVGAAIEYEGGEIGTEKLFGLEIAKGLAPRKRVIELLEEIKDLGVRPWIVSASAQVIVDAGTKYWGIEAPCIGVRTMVANGRLTAQVIEPMSIADGKVLCIQSEIDPVRRPILGIGDSGNDLPMLEYSEIKVVVDRGNALAEKARREGWFLC